MGTLCRWFSKSVILIKRHKWLVVFLTIVLIALTSPLFILCIENFALMDSFLVCCPFVIPSFILSVWCSQIITFPSNFASIVSSFSFFSIWAVVILSVILSARNKKMWRYVAYFLLLIDVFCNLILTHYIAISIDIVLLTLVILSIKTKTDK